MQINVGQFQFEFGLILLAPNLFHRFRQQRNSLVRLVELIGHDVSLNQGESCQVVGIDVVIGIVNALRQTLVCFRISVVLCLQPQIVGLNGSRQCLPIKRTAFALIQNIVIALLSNVELLVVQANASQIVDLCILVVGLAVDALALGEGNVVILLLQGKPNQKLGILQIVRFVLCLPQQGNAQLVRNAVVHIVEHHGLQAVTDIVVLTGMGFQLQKIVPERLLIVGR